MSRHATYRGAIDAPESRWIRAANWLILLPPLFALLAGCGGTASASRTADPEAARAALREAMESWKRGDSLAAPAGLSPPVRVEDEAWLAGTRLVTYKIDDRTEPRGDRLRCPVVLTLADARGKTRVESAVYDVATDGITSVVRQDRP